MNLCVPLYLAVTFARYQNSLTTSHRCLTSAYIANIMDMDFANETMYYYWVLVCLLNFESQNEEK